MEQQKVTTNYPFPPSESSPSESFNNQYGEGIEEGAKQKA